MTDAADLIVWRHGRTEWNEQEATQAFGAISRLIVPGNPIESRFLLKPLHPDGGGSYAHNGVRRWQSRNDPEWQMLASWVRGEKLRPILQPQRALVPGAGSDDNGSFEIDDGSGPLRVFVGAPVAGDLGDLEAGAWVEVHGALGQETTGSQPAALSRSAAESTRVPSRSKRKLIGHRLHRLRIWGNSVLLRNCGSSRRDRMSIDTAMNILGAPEEPDV